MLHEVSELIVCPARCIPYGSVHAGGIVVLVLDDCVDHLVDGSSTAVDVFAVSGLLGSGAVLGRFPDLGIIRGPLLHGKCEVGRVPASVPRLAAKAAQTARTDRGAS